MVVGKAEVRVHTGVVCARADNAGGGHLGPPQPGHGVQEQALRAACSGTRQSRGSNSAALFAIQSESMMASASAYAAAQMLAAPAAAAVDGPARAQPIDHPAKVTTSDSVAGRPDIT